MRCRFSALLRDGSRLFGIVLLLFVGAVAVTTHPPVAHAAVSTSYPNAVFSDGFESGSLSAWDPNPSGTISVVAGAAHSGAFGARLTNPAGQASVMTKTFGWPLPDSSVGFWVRVGSAAGLESVAQARDQSSSAILWALLYDPTQRAFWFYPRRGSASTEIFTGANTAPLNTWLHIEVRYTASATGGAQLYINGQTQTGWGVSGDYTTTQELQKIELSNDVSNTTDVDDVTVATPAPTPPDAPTGVTAQPGDASAAVAWTAPLNNGNAPITGYQITPYVGGVAQTPIQTGSSSTMFVVGGLTVGTSYTFTVTAVNQYGSGPPSAPSGPITATHMNAVAFENSLPGDPSWGDFAAPPDPTGISGYASTASVRAGDSLDLYTTTTASSVKIDVFRMGWYGGAGARLVQSVGTFPGANQPQATPDPALGTVTEHWAKTTSLTIPQGWTSGVYLVRLLASNGYGGFITFVVRDDSGTEPILFQASITTYQAYNAYGGTSLYNNNTDGSIYKAPHAMKVSFDRPYLNGNGAGQFLSFEYPMLRWLEQNGYNMAYTTNVDTDMGTVPLTNHRVFLSVGHDEYWSKGMRDAVEGAIASGVNVAFFAGNESYWQVRFEPNAAGAPDRVMVGYKDFANCACAPGPDPVWNVNNSVLTGLWRDPQVNRPEEQMMGVMFGGETFNSPYVVENASSWVYAGTGWTNGTSVPGIVGYEYDHYFGDANTPANITLLSNSPLTNTENGQPDTANSTLYTASSGAQVFAAGTIQWSWGLDGFGGSGMVNAGVQRVTSNILARFTAPAGSTTVPGAPTAVTGTPGNGTVALGWSAPASNGGSPITGYRITPFIGTTAQTAILTGSTATSYTVTGLTNGTAYTFTVAAINANGTGAASSASAPITPSAVPGAPDRSHRHRR